MERTNFGMLLAKIEGTYGIDPTPTAALNLMAVTRAGVQFSVKYDHLTRQILDGTLSKVSGLNAMPEVQLNFAVEIRGNRTNGAAHTDISEGASTYKIEIDPLLRACDLVPTYTVETVSGNRDGYVIYTPTVPTNEGESVTFYYYTGNKLHKITGAKGTVNGKLDAGKFAMLDFSFKGIYNAITDAAIPSSPTWLNTTPPIFVNSGSTVGAYSPVFQSLNFDLGNSIARRDDANATTGVRGFLKINRDSKLTIDPESVAEATSPFWADLAAGTPRTITGLLGTQSGNKFSATFAGVPQGVGYGDRSGIRTQPIDYSIERANLSDAPGAEFQLKFY